LLARGRREGKASGKRSVFSQRFRSRSERIEILSGQVGESTQVEGSRVLCYPTGHSGLIELRAIRVDYIGSACKRSGDDRSVGGAKVGLDPRSDARRCHHQAYSIAATQKACRNRRRLVDDAIERSASGHPCPQFDRRIDNQPNDLTFVALHLAHE
jgi:hypothetical protein